MRARRSAAGLSVVALLASGVWIGASLLAPTPANAQQNPALDPDSGYVEGLATSGEPGEGPGLAFWLANEFPAGVTHIARGPDHLAFVAGLTLLLPGLRNLCLAVSCFTLAHALTLTLVSLGLVPFAPSHALWVELAVALSVLWLGVENLWLRGLGSDAASTPAALRAFVRRRALMAFVFGLVHGLAFSEHFRAAMVGASEERSTQLGPLLLRILAFNVGVDAGQLAVVALLSILLLVVARGGPGPRRLALPVGSALIAALGLVWSGERLLAIAA